MLTDLSTYRLMPPAQYPCFCARKFCIPRLISSCFSIHFGQANKWMNLEMRLKEAAAHVSDLIWLGCPT